MTRKVYIDSFLKEAKDCSCGEKKSKRKNLDAAKKAIAEAALKSIIRSLQTEGYINEEKTEVSKTARRINPDRIGRDFPTCPPGYVFSKERMDCIPKREKDKVSGRLNTNTSTGDSDFGASYRVWGRTGINGDGYAYEDKPGLDANATHWDGEVHEGKRGLWDNIHAKRRRGEEPAKKGDKDYPKTLNIENTEDLEEQKKCKDGYEYDKDQKKCVRKKDFNRSNRTTIIYTPPSLGGGHHGSDDDDRDGSNNGGDSSGGGDGGGMAEGIQVGTSFIREVCKRCGRGLVKNAVCQCLQARDTLYPRLSDRVR